MRNQAPLLSSEAGFTLLELIMIIIVLAIAIPVVLIALGQGAKQGVAPEAHVAAANVGQALMEEIRSKRWDENSPIPPGAYSTLGIDGGETPGNPATYDDIDDFTSGIPAVSVGSLSFARAVEVCYVTSVDLNNVAPCIVSSASATDYKRIKITVTNQLISGVEIVTVMTNY
jgi:MSHA pilin protein MshD